MSFSNSSDYSDKIWSELKKKEIPSKFAYVGTGSKLHNDFANSLAYEKNLGSVDVHIRALERLFKNSKKRIQICDIGSGNGNRLSVLIKGLEKKRFSIEKLLLIDYSSSLLSICSEKIRLNYPEIHIEEIFWDFEEGPSQKILTYRNNLPLILIFGGNTLGNVTDPKKVLLNHYLSCSSGDYYILEISLKKNEINYDYTRGYKSDSFYLSALEPLKMVGIDVNNGELRINYSQEEEAVIGEFVFHKKTSIIKDNEVLSFDIDDKIRCFNSRRFHSEEIRSILIDLGWNILVENTDFITGQGVFILQK